MVPIAAVLAVFRLAAPAHATDCSVRAQYQGEGWFAAYMGYGLELIGDGNCFEDNGHYLIVTVWCGEVAVVEVTA